MSRYLITLAAVCSIGAFADEGMWTYNNFPSAAVNQKYGFSPSQEWLDNIRLSSLRIAGGCSASFVGANGLVMTNHHCARPCIDDLSGIHKRNYSAQGFYAPTQAKEARCPNFELNQLVEITDVTAKVAEGTKGVPQDKYLDAQRGVLNAIEKACATSDDVRCEVVELYRGGEYNLYKYRRLQDVRLVMAPEEAIAFFGGDPDNFNFPRWDLDVTFLRVYGKDGKPLRTDHFLRWSTAPLKEGDLTFISGHPGKTDRSLTISEIQNDLDVSLPRNLIRLSEMRGLLGEFRKRNAASQQAANDPFFSVENSFKALSGQRAALLSPEFMGTLKKNEKDLRDKIRADPKLEAEYGKIWDNIAEGQRTRIQPKILEFAALERGIVSNLFDIARKLVRRADEMEKPNGERLTEYSDSRLPQLKARILSAAPISDDLEIANLSISLERMREDLGTEHPVVKKLFAGKSAPAIATALVKRSRLKDLKVDRNGQPVGGYRKELFDGGKAAIDASKDPMIEFARSFDAEARAARKPFDVSYREPIVPGLYYQVVDSESKKQHELLAKARFAMYGRNTYPDATFTLRLSYGAIKGFPHYGKTVPPFTDMGGAYTHATGSPPFELPKSWLAAEKKVNKSTQFNFATTNDIIGGNSGSPVVNKDGAVIGLVFDGNIYSLGGNFGFDETQNRAISVTTSSISEALEKIYGASRLVTELQESGATK